ncbi:MAG: hypothetical protein FWC57_02300, partial [Endomicrobia bacterium]|nr:hypothetical protein [Endomicrobiia bacterium]
MKKKRVVQIFVIAALLVIILGSFLVKKGFIYMPSPGDIAFRPYKSLMSIFKRTPRENDNRFSNVMVNPPNITQYYDDGSGNVVESKPDPITFYFYESAAKLEMLDKDVTGIKMSPEAEGVWRWADEHSLVFYPKNDWPAGEKYKIKFPKDIFSPSFALSEYSYTVATPDFSASLNNFQLYQDPKNPKIRQLQASFSFTHAVDTKYFEKNLSLKIDKKDFPFKVTYDKLKRNAFIVSDPVSILTKDQVAVIELSSARAAAGGKDMRDKIKQAYGIPSQDKFFRIANVDAIIVNNDQEEPEQFISLEFTDGVDAKQLQGKVEAYLLPMLNPDTNKQQNDRIEVTGGDKDSGDGGDGDYGEEGTRDRIVRPYSYQWSFSEVTPAVLNKSKKLDLKQMDNASDISGVYMFKYNAPDMANRYVYVKINEGIVSQTDFAIKKPFSTLVTSAGFPKQVSLLQNGAILPLDGSRMLTFKTRGVSGVKVDIARVMPSQINHLISQTYSYGSFAHPGFKNEYDFNEYNISQCFSKVIPLNISIEKANYSTVDMNEFLKSQGASGLFFVKIKGYTPSTNTDEGVSDSRFILATDMGILAKKDYTKKYNVFVMSIKSGRPVAGAKVDVLGKNGIPVLTQYTDEQGCAVFNKIDGFQYEKQPVAYIVTKGDDTSFMPFNSSDRAVDYSKFDTGGEFASENKSRGIKAFVFSD